MNLVVGVLGGRLDQMLFVRNQYTVEGSDASDYRCQNQRLSIAAVVNLSWWKSPCANLCMLDNGWWPFAHRLGDEFFMSNSPHSL